MAASYDAVRLYALAIRDLVQANKTLSGSEIATNLRAVSMKTRTLAVCHKYFIVHDIYKFVVLLCTMVAFY